MSCDLKGLIGDKICGNPEEGRGQPYDNFAVMSPFVKVTFSGGGGVLTVGNESCPNNNNNAVITEMKLGSSNGMILELHVSDVQGGQFYTFFNNLVKCIDQIFISATLDYGWIGVDCNGNKKIKAVSDNGGPVNILLVKAKVDKSNGIYHYQIEGRDGGAIATAGTKRKAYGDDGKGKLELKLAIQQLCEQDGEGEGPKMKVEFLRKKKGGGTEPWEFEAINDKPKGGWRTDNKNKIQIIYDWIRPYKTDDDKGIFITYDDTSKEPKIILWENSLPECDISTVDATCGSNLGNFIVNGGNCSSVLDFNPSLDWILTWASKTQGGEAGSPVSAASEEKEGATPKTHRDECTKKQLKDAGIPSNIAIDSNAVLNYGKDAIKFAEECQNAHQLANAQFTVGNAVEADLRIMGTVEKGFGHIMDFINNSISIAVINPFYIDNSGSEECPVWLQQSKVNQVFSHKYWLLKQNTQEISGGKFTTTLHVTLIGAPGADIPEGDLLGGDGPIVNCTPG